MKTPLMHTSTTYRSVIDSSSCTMIAIITAICFMPAIIDFSIISVAIGSLPVITIIYLFLTTYYTIDADTLTVHCAFTSGKYPISMIARISPTRSILSAPATSLTQRIALSFSDRKVMKSSMPLIISPANRTKFINQLKAINPNITIINL
ncbi:MAG: PH domain-containing protein [Muribaculaceae bacterium]